MYQQLRSSGTLSYANVETRFEEHQAKWPEAIFNEDAWSKYIGPLINPDEGKESTAVYLPMAQGSKAEQRKWWLYNRFRYMDSKWLAGDARNDVIQLRGYAKADITLTPYTDIYPSIRYGSYTVSERGTHGVPTTLACPIDTLNDTEIYIYSAPQLASVGDLSPLKVGFADFSKATNLQSIVVGSAASGYENRNLTNLNVGNNSLLRTIDARNCPALTGALDFSGATNVEHVYLDGTSATSVLLPVGGILKTLRLPSTVTSLTVRDQRMIETFAVDGDGYGSITTLRVENSSSVIPVLDILNGMPENSRVRIIGFTAFVDETKDVEDFFDYLDTMRGLDEAGNNLEKPVVAGTIAGLGTITGEWLARMNARYPDVTITYQHINSTLRYYSYDGSTLITSETVTDGGNGTYTGTPSRTSTAQYSYSFAGWSLYQDQSTADPNAIKNVTADRDVYAAYTATLRTYTVTWKNGSTTLETDTNVPYGSMPHYDGATPTQDGQSATGWTPTPATVTGDVTYTAVYAPVDTITDSWEQIAQHIKAGDYATRYSVGDTKNLDLGSEGIVNMQIAGFDIDDLSDGSGKGAISWVSEQAVGDTIYNPERETAYKYEDGPSWRQTSSYYNWGARNGMSENSVARMSFDIVAKSDYSIYFGRYFAYDGLVLTVSVGGQEVVHDDGIKSENRYTQFDITSGLTYHVSVECANDSGVGRLNSSIVNFAICKEQAMSSSSYGVSGYADILEVTNIVIEDCPICKIDHYVEGTGFIGGYPHSELRQFVNDTIATNIQNDVMPIVSAAAKAGVIRDTNDAPDEAVWNDKVWVPSYREVLDSSPRYPVFSTSTNRIKKGVSTNNPVKWWIADTGSSSWTAVSESGYSTTPNSTASVAFGFCTGIREYDDAISDSWEEIIASTKDGSYSEKYKVGDKKALALGSEGLLLMRIAAFDYGVLEDDSSCAIVWVADRPIVTKKSMADSKESWNWESSNAYNWLNSELLAMMPKSLNDAIRPRKNIGKIWLLAGDEISSESAAFGSLFGTSQKRMLKTQAGADAFWLLRSKGTYSASESQVNTLGQISGTVDSNTARHLVIGFCL